MMTPERWERVQSVWNAVSGVRGTDRDARLEELCAEDIELKRLIRSMLEADADERPFADAVSDAIAGAADAAHAPEGRKVGRYRLLSEIGSGGMGTVYAAERDDEFHQRVAIKIVRGLLDPDRLRRFRAERQILASLEHPHIARLLDGGTTDEGFPYIVMEYVDGVPLDEYVRSHALEVRARLALFLDIASAVSYAHRQLVVHRDIKPANIIVTADGTAKLLDFGIAKLLSEDEGFAPVRTITGLRLLTPEYAAPEQVRGGAITTTTDVYGLGVLLYEVLTAQRPHQFSTLTPQEIEHVVCDEDPRKPSALVATLDPDLDVIVMTALQKEPTMRYASVDAFAADVRRFLEGRPIEARPATWRYRGRRFALRHAVGVVVTTLFATFIFVSAVVMMVQARRIARERDTAEQVSRFLIEIFQVSDPGQARGNSVTARELLDRGAERITSELEGEPIVQARLMDTIGSVYGALGLSDRAGEIYERSLAVHERASGRRDPETARAIAGLADTLRERAQYDKAETLQREVLDIRRETLGAMHPDVAASLNALGLTLTARAKYDEAEKLLRESAAMTRATLGPQHLQVAIVLNNLGQLLRRRASYDESEQVLREALEIRRRSLAAPHPLLANSVMQLGQVLADRGRFDEAEPLMRESLAMRERVLGADHQVVGISSNNLASLLQDKGDYAAAEPLYRRALAIGVKSQGPRHPETAVTMNNLATLLGEMGRPADAEPLLRQALAIRREALGDKHPAVARGMHNLARVLLAEGKVDEAETLERASLPIRRAALGDRHYEVGVHLTLLAAIDAAQRRPAEADATYKEGIGILRERLAKDHPVLARGLYEYAKFLADAGRIDEARPIAEEAAAIRRVKLPAAHPDRIAADALVLRMSTP
jgi:serine/threonine-protein kinase